MLPRSGRSSVFSPSTEKKEGEGRGEFVWYGFQARPSVNLHKLGGKSAEKEAAEKRIEVGLDAHNNPRLSQRGWGRERVQRERPSADGQGLIVWFRRRENQAFKRGRHVAKANGTSTFKHS